MSILGTRVIRTEDPRLLTAGGVYVDDLREPDLQGAVRATFVRSSVAHARITGIDTSAALAQPGVVAVLTAADMTDMPPPPPAGEPDPDAPPAEGPMPLGGKFAEPLLTSETVRFVGEPVAIVLTDGTYQGEDAAELVSVDYDVLPAAATIAAALEDETILFTAAGTNVCTTGGGDTSDDSIFDGLDVVVEGDIVNQRVAALPMEGRATAAVFKDGKLTVWTSTQNAQLARLILTAVGLPPDAIRVIAPDVGGGFGAKIGADRESIVVAWAAKHIGRPVRWVETRYENLTAMTQGRAQLQHVKIGGTRDGDIKAYRIDVVQDAGAYPRMSGFLPSMTMLMASGVYDIPNVQAGYSVVVTNSTPIAAYRGAGRPEAAAAIERAVDMFAAEAGLDPVRVRRRNFVKKEQFPFVTKTGAPYDSGDYESVLDKVLARAGYDELRAEQRKRRAAGDVTQLGIGVISYVEITAGDAGAGETARIDVHGDGTATVYTGSSSHGQGHHTAFAMLVQDELGIPMDKVEVIHGDTDLVPDGVGTYASRSLQLGGSAVHKAAIEVKDDAAKRAATLFEASEQDVVLDRRTGQWQIAGDPDKSLSWSQVATAAEGGTLTANVRFAADRPTFPFGAQLALVEVDTETGKVTLVRHVTADDAGPVLNPVLLEGQRHGGIAQGVGQALVEEVLYDADGNPLTSTLADYGAITAAELPSFELLTSETATDLNPLGVKGIGEAGTIGATPAVQNAVVDALAHLGVRHVDMPTTPERVWTAIQAAGHAAGQAANSSKAGAK
ncbi:MAG TPA: xanthine dehydrogenase family protein molybdopterin-binding subunit [Trebonia sp.]|jgi:carbon-monoxide dehydrogenase large subunit|nr:xanthine dehydrogenase family protein molybdopterin-binding subunit [Trebonia sp.]